MTPTAPASVPVRHPAKFNDHILAAIRTELHVHLPNGGVVLDPFAGVGRIHELVEYTTIGVELEPEWAAQHPDTILGNALRLPFHDGTFDAVVTSPCYGNRMADDFIDRQPERAYVRNTYTHAIGRKLHADNAGAMQWSDEYRRFHIRAWREALRVLRPGGFFVLNVKDHIRAGTRERVAGFHVATLCMLGAKVIDVLPIPSAGLRQGANSEARVDAELLITFQVRR